MALLSSTAAKALMRPVETSLRELIEEYGYDVGSGLLVSLNQLKDNLKSFEISCDPPVGYGGLDDKRVLSTIALEPTVKALSVIEEGEKADVEFKSSMLLDLRRYRQQPDEPLETYRNEGVTRSLMKTIAAFANSGGGTVFVGVEDDTSVCGLAIDFILANSQRCDFDGWDQCLRGQIESKFFDGKSVANYVRAAPLLHEGRTFVQIQVANRTSIAFLKRNGGGAELYVRSGTRSIPIEFQDMEKHYKVIRQF